MSFITKVQGIAKTAALAAVQSQLTLRNYQTDNQNITEGIVQSISNDPSGNPSQAVVTMTDGTSQTGTVGSRALIPGMPCSVIGGRVF